MIDPWEDYISPDDPDYDDGTAAALGVTFDEHGFVKVEALAINPAHAYELQAYQHMALVASLRLPCPHCDEPSFRATPHVCADKGRWTQDQRDAYRVQARRRWPWLAFVSGNAMSRL